MKKLYPYLLLSPLIFLGAIFALGVCNALIQSLGYIPAFEMKKLTLDYYRAVISDPALFASVKTSLHTALISSVVSVVAGVALCSVIVSSRGRSSHGIFAGMTDIIRIPILVPHTVVAFFIIIILSQSGLLSRLMYAAGLVSAPEDFPMILFGRDSAGVIIGYIWKEAPFVAYFVMSFMSSIDDRLGEAARNLGASPLQSFFHIVLPLCLPVINKAFVMIFAFAFGAYELPFLLGATTPRALPVQAYIEYMHPDLRHRAYAMAMNGIILVITLGISVIYYWLTKKAERIEGKHYE